MLDWKAPTPEDMHVNLIFDWQTPKTEHANPNDESEHRSKSLSLGAFFLMNYAFALYKCIARRCLY